MFTFKNVSLFSRKNSINEQILLTNNSSNEQPYRSISHAFQLNFEWWEKRGRAANVTTRSRYIYSIYISKSIERDVGQEPFVKIVKKYLAIVVQTFIFERIIGLVLLIQHINENKIHDLSCFFFFFLVSWKGKRFDDGSPPILQQTNVHSLNRCK